MSESPEADILLLRRNSAKWTAMQRGCLADGIRNSEAAHILLEFKYTESVNENVCGIYKSTHSLLNSIILISLNELSNEVFNLSS